MKNTQPRIPYLLIISSKTPYFSADYQDALEAVMSAKNAELCAKFVLLGDACYQLRAQLGKEVGRKNLQKQLSLLELYEIDDLYYCSPPSYINDKLGIIDTNFQLLEQDAFNKLLINATHVMAF